MPSHRKGVTREEEYGKTKALRLKQQAIQNNIGKKYSDEVNKKKGLKGELNPMKIFEHREKQKLACRTYGRQWRGGLSYLPYTAEFDRSLKAEIRKRDMCICQWCGVDEIKLPTNLHVHHINYDKADNNKENLISLCNTCHSKTNWDRGIWIEYFKKINIGVNNEKAEIVMVE